MAVEHGERGFRFCPHCGGAFNARILKEGEPARLVCDACGFVFYLDPKVAVGTIIRTADDEIVLCRRAIEPGYGRWVFPGGYVDRGEKLEEAAIREAREECGLDVELEGLVSLHSYRGQDAHHHRVGGAGGGRRAQGGRRRKPGGPHLFGRHDSVG